DCCSSDRGGLAVRNRRRWLRSVVGPGPGGRGGGRDFPRRRRGRVDGPGRAGRTRARVRALGGGGGGGGGGAGGGRGGVVRAERAEPALVFGRWKAGRRAAVAALRGADPDEPVPWVTGRIKPATLATTRLGEDWGHGLDITGPLGPPSPDTARLRHIAWLAHGTLPYAFALAGDEAHPVYCELTGPGGDTWRYGPADADSALPGAAGRH